MRTYTPKFGVWVVAVVIGGLGLLGRFVVIPVGTEYSFWLVAIGFVVLALASIIKGR